MVDCLRRKQNIKLCTYADVICPRAHAYQMPSAEQSADNNKPDRFGVSINLRDSDIWLEPLNDTKPRRKRDRETSPAPEYRYTTADCTDSPASYSGLTFDVCVTRGPRGLGLSIEGGDGLWAGHVRVKRVFPHEPAAQTGQIRTGDVILRVNDLPIRGLSVQEALNVLRVAGSEVLLSLVRPAEDDGSDISESEQQAEVAPVADRPGSRPTLDLDCSGTFTVVMEKVNSSLGLSLRRSDDTVLGHSVKAKVREPALSDPRVRVGDRLVQVNGVDMTGMSHAEAVSFLRQCPSPVTLTLYRDAQATPGSPGSPVTARSTRLRPEAVEMLTDLAFRRELYDEPAGGGQGGSPPAEVARKSSSRAEQVRRLSCGSRGSPRLGRRRRKSASPDLRSSPGVIQSPLVRLENMDTVAPSSTERLAQLTRISESSLAGPELDDWPDSGDDSDAELHERHLSRLVSGGGGDSPRLGHSGADSPSAGGSFSRRNQPTYLSVQPQQRTKVRDELALKRVSSEERLDSGGVPEDSGVALLKWKGFTLDGTDQETDSGIVSSGGEGTARGQCLNIQLRRGWSARLGFSLQPIEGSHVVSQIHPDSVAERDGRLQVGDLLLKVNDESVQGMTNEEVIDMLRKTRGAIGLTILRP